MFETPTSPELEQELVDATEKFLTPANFQTCWDDLPNNRHRHARKQYDDGLAMGKLASEITISVTNVWQAVMKDTSVLQSYERIGYHACTQHLLQGFFDSGVRIVVYRILSDRKIYCRPIK